MNKILSFFVFLVLPLSFVHVVDSKTLRITNQCSHQVCPVVPSNARKPSLLLSKGCHKTALQPGQSINISVSSGSGSIWGRTPYTKDSDERKFRILIKDSRSHMEESGGAISHNLQKPISTTIATFMLNGTDGLDHYEVSLRNGYNLPMLLVPVHDGSGSGSGGHCRSAGCTVNSTSLCPPDLRFSEGRLGCKSACQAFEDPNFCFTSNGIGLTDSTRCNPNFYTKFFKKACPKANSFVDDTSSLFSCPLCQDYSLIFCPSPSTTSNKQQPKLTIPVAIFAALLAALLSARWCWFGDGISICNSNCNNNCCNFFNRN